MSKTKPPKGFILLTSPSGQTRLSRRTIAERDALVLQWVHLPKHVINKLAPLGMPRADFADAESEGFTGLIRGCELFDDTRGFKASTYLFHAIARKVGHFLRHRGLIHVPEHHFYLGIPQEFQQLRDQASRFCVLPEDFDIAEEVEEEHASYDDVERLQSMLQILPERDRMILVEHISNGRTLKELGQELGYSRERIRQIKEESLYELKKRFGTPPRKRCRAKFLMYQGVRLSIRGWAQRLGIKPNTLWSRWLSGWSTKRILTTPVKQARKVG